MSLSREVSRINGTSLPVALSLRHSAKPSTSGMLTSLTTSSTSPAPSARKPTAPSGAVWTLCPASSKASDNTSSKEGSSSIKSTRAMLARLLDDALPSAARDIQVKVIAVRGVVIGRQDVMKQLRASDVAEQVAQLRRRLR